MGQVQGRPRAGAGDEERAVPSRTSLEAGSWGRAVPRAGYAAGMQEGLWPEGLGGPWA